jgi:pterin-4a-carbinolamine dehydratase
VPTILDDGLLTETLKALPGWQGDTHAIWRDLKLAPSVDAELRRQVAVDGGAMGHPPEVQDRGDGVTRYTLSTDGGVSELDIAFASHLSDLAHRIAASEPGIDAVRAGDPIVIFRAGEDTQQP